MMHDPSAAEVNKPSRKNSKTPEDTESPSPLFSSKERCAKTLNPEQECKRRLSLQEKGVDGSSSSEASFEIPIVSRNSAGLIMEDNKRVGLLPRDTEDSSRISPAPRKTDMEDCSRISLPPRRIDPAKIGKESILHWKSVQYGTDLDDDSDYRNPFLKWVIGNFPEKIRELVSNCGVSGPAFIRLLKERKSRTYIPEYITGALNAYLPYAGAPRIALKEDWDLLQHVRGFGHLANMLSLEPEKIPFFATLHGEKNPQGERVSVSVRCKFMKTAEDFAENILMDGDHYATYQWRGVEFHLHPLYPLFLAFAEMHELHLSPSTKAPKSAKVDEEPTTAPKPVAGKPPMSEIVLLIEGEKSGFLGANLAPDLSKRLHKNAQGECFLELSKKMTNQITRDCKQLIEERSSNIKAPKGCQLF